MNWNKVQVYLHIFLLLEYMSEISDCLVDEGRAVDIFYLDFSKAYDNVSQKIHIENLSMYRLDEQWGGLKIG